MVRVVAIDRTVPVALALRRFGHRPPITGARAQHPAAPAGRYDNHPLIEAVADPPVWFMRGGGLEGAAGLVTIDRSPPLPHPPILDAITEESSDTWSGAQPNRPLADAAIPATFGHRHHR